MQTEASSPVGARNAMMRCGDEQQIACKSPLIVRWSWSWVRLTGKDEAKENARRRMGDGYASDRRRYRIGKIAVI
jgi:hypothetical protein